MPGPAKAGAVIYAKDVNALARFYRELLGAEVLHAENEYIVLQTSDIQLVVYAIPKHIASTFEMTSPPEPREETAIKLFFTVSSIEWARVVIPGLGGVVHAQVWQGQGFSACNAIDPEGNILQVREITIEADPHH